MAEIYPPGDYFKNGTAADGKARAQRSASPRAGSGSDSPLGSGAAAPRQPMRGVGSAKRK